DFYKLGKPKTVYVAPIVMLVLVLINFILLWTQNAIFEGLTLDDETLETLLTGKDLLFGASTTIELGIFIAIICGIFIGGDFLEGTLKLQIARGQDKIAVYFSKWLTLCVLTIGYILGSFLLCGILTAATGYGAQFTGQDFGLLIRAIVLQILVGIADTSIFVMIAFLTRSQGSAIATSLVLLLVSEAVLTILAAIGIMTEKDILVEISNFLPSAQIATAKSYAINFTLKEALEVTLIPLGDILISTAIGTLTFEKRDIN
ncbi:MAG: ABC transporter permease, partial [Clostridia bacterium]|nr:ABC transporter permease [Clostridia bacterium]